MTPIELTSPFPLFETQTEVYLWMNRIASTWNAFFTRFLNGELNLHPDEFLPLFRATRTRLQLVLTTVEALPDGSDTYEIRHTAVQSMRALKVSVDRFRQYLKQRREQRQGEGVFVMEEVVPEGDASVPLNPLSH